MSDDAIRFDLPQSAIPTAWYNIQADLPRPLPAVLHPGTKQPIGPHDLAPLFPMDLILQEVSQERYIEIPEEVREIFKLWRPTPLLRARRLEKALDTPPIFITSMRVFLPAVATNSIPQCPKPTTTRKKAFKD
jgi:tryptophan synthase beta chain